MAPAEYVRQAWTTACALGRTLDRYPHRPDYNVTIADTLGG